MRGCIRIFGPDPCAGAAFIISSIGVAACVDLALAEAGVGYEWGGDFDLFWGSCDLSPWRPAPAGARAAAVLGRYRLPAGMPSAAWKVEGEGEAPGVTLTGPNGEAVTIARDTPSVQQGQFSVARGEYNATYVFVRRPAAGE